MTTVRHALNAKNRIPWKSVVSGASNIIVFQKTGANDEKNYERDLRKTTDVLENNLFEI
jgi:hypothetical protein